MVDAVVDLDPGKQTRRLFFNKSHNLGGQVYWHTYTQAIPLLLQWTETKDTFRTAVIEEKDARAKTNFGGSI